MARIREERTVYKLLVGNPEGKRPLGRTRPKQEDGMVSVWFLLLVRLAGGCRLDSGG
jgi:hypothetical protein